jgi:phosphoribosylaminoimidazole carboxylase (NCAIR synthetase)
MMTKKARTLGCWVLVLDPDASAPAGQVAAEQVVGSFDDIEALRTLTSRCG